MKDWGDGNTPPPVKDQGTSAIRPAHYRQGAIEVIVAIEALFGDQYHAGNVLKYLARYRYKNGIEDLKKAEWYLQRLIQLEQEKSGASTNTPNQLETKP
tara:strand:+ start:6624 stop:6920 length:297 start_codon:yes stop_codon:yes gene_type:complete